MSRATLLGFVLSASLSLPWSAAIAQSNNPTGYDLPMGFTRAYFPDNETTGSASSDERGRSLARVMVLPSGALRIKDQIFTLYGVGIPPLDRVCRTTSGLRWRCGVNAIVALHNLVRLKLVSCEINGRTAITRTCRLEDTDIALWMLQKGLAELDDRVDEPRYAAAASEAKRMKIGIWAENLPQARPL